MGTDKKNTVRRGKVVDFSQSFGYGTIDAGGEMIYFTYKDLPIKDGKFLIPKAGTIVEFTVEPDSLYGKVAKNIRFVN